MHDYKTCTHTYDSGRTCKSAAAKGREFCGYHLHYRGRLLRRAQSRARHQQYDIILPPLDTLCSIQSALSQVAEALAADMIDPRRAMGLLKALRFAKENLRDGLKDDSAHWHDTPYLTQDAAAYDNFEAEYGLPKDIDITTPPEVAFPPPAVILSEERSDESKDPYHSIHRDRAPLIPEIPPPVVRDYTAEAEIAIFESTPEDIELMEIMKEQGYKAMESRAREHQRNADRKMQRKLFRANYVRYVAEAKLKNIQRAAEKLLAERLAADKAAAQNTSATPDAETFLDTTRKPVVSADTAPGDTFAAKKENAIA
jgi:hypothetical protein